MKKRFLASILSILMIISSLNITVFGWGFPVGETEYGNESEWLTAEQIAVLYRSGVSDWQNIGNMQSEAGSIVTRAKATKYISRMAGLNASEAGDFESLFKDLTSEHEYYKYIKAVATAGYMQGDPDGYFRPDEAITTTEVATVLLRCLGYKPIVAMAGINKAFNMTKILDGVPVQDKVNTAQLLRMIYNALNSPAISSNAFKLLNDGTVDVNYLIDKDYLGFQHLLGLISARGVLEAIPSTALTTPKTSLKDNRVVVAGAEYEYEGDATEFLGYDINYFYKKISDKRRELVYMYKSDRNEEFVLTHDVINSFADGVYTYERNNSTKKIVLSGTHDVIFNDMANPNYTDAEMNPAFGKVTFINNNGDNTYDVIKIVSYDFYVSSRMSDDGKTLYFKNNAGEDGFIDFKAEDVVEIWDRGEIIEPNRLKSNQLLAVRETSDSSGGGKKYIIECQKADASNVKITSLKKASFVTDDGMAFTMWDDIVGTLDMDTMYNIYTWDGVVVAAISLENSGFQNAYLVDFGVDFGVFGEVSAKIAVVDTMLKYQIFDIAERGYFDGEPYTKADLSSTTFEEALKFSAKTYSVGYDSKYPYAQPVKISFNNKGQVNKIDTYDLGASEDPEETLQHAKVYNAENGELVSLGNKETIEARYYGGGFYYTNVSVGGYNQMVDTVGATIIFVPKNRNEEISYTTGSIYSFNNGYSYSFDIVGQDRNEGTAEVMYYYYDETQVDYLKSTPGIVAELYQELNSDGDVQCIVGIYEGATFKNLIADETVFNTLNIGDVCYFKTNSKNEILDVKTQYSPVEGLGDVLVADEGSVKYLGEVVGSVVGTALNMTGGVVKFALEKPQDIPKGVDNEPVLKDIATCVYSLGATSVFKFSTFNGAPKVEVASISDIVTYKQKQNDASLIIVNKTVSNNAASQIYIIEQ